MIAKLGKLMAESFIVALCQAHLIKYGQFRLVLINIYYSAAGLSNSIICRTASGHCVRDE